MAMRCGVQTDEPSAMRHESDGLCVRRRASGGAPGRERVECDDTVPSEMTRVCARRARGAR